MHNRVYAISHCVKELFTSDTLTTHHLKMTPTVHLPRVQDRLIVIKPLWQQVCSISGLLTRNTMFGIYLHAACLLLSRQSR